MDAPATRYKVVERGRRLEVIDTWNGNAPVRTLRDPAPSPRSGPAPRSHDAGAAVESIRASRLDQQGRALLNTAGWYDAKGPRTITLSERGESKLQALGILALAALLAGAFFTYLLWPFTLFLPLLLMNGDTRTSLCAAATRFLDRLGQAAT